MQFFKENLPDEKLLRRYLILTLPLAILIVITSIIGIIFEGTYSQEVPEYAAQGIGQDIINLIVIVPTMLAAAVMMERGKRPALFVWLGGLTYTLYSFTTYCFGIHFNGMFLVYCAILGYSFYLLMGFLINIEPEFVKGWFGSRAPLKMASVFLCVVATLFYLIWLQEVIPAMIDGQAPELVREYGLLTNPIHVLDIAIALPGFIISAILIAKRRAIGYVLAPTFIVFIVLMSIAIGGMIAIMGQQGFDADLGLTMIFSIIASISGIIFILLMKRLKEGPRS